MANTQPSRDDKPVEWQDAIKENPFLFAALLLVLSIVVLLACLFIYLLGFSNNSAPQSASPPTTMIQFSTPTPGSPVSGAPSINLDTTPNEAGTIVTLTGQNWAANDTLLVRVEALGDNQDVQPLSTNVQNTDQGAFTALFVLPANTVWDNLSSIRVTVASTSSDQKATIEFNLEVTAPTFSPSPTNLLPPPPNSTPTPTTIFIPSPGDWQGEYYPNPNLVGDPRLVRREQGINLNWGLDAPDPALPNDGFSVRWTRTLGLEMAVYRFHIQATDGVRLWINEQLVVDDWFTSPAREVFVDYPAAFQGSHNIRLEYVNFSGPAQISLWWEKIGTQLPSCNFSPTDIWLGEYYPNITLSGNPAYSRNDLEINFNWGFGPPAPALPDNNYSVCWVRLVDFEADNYRFYLTVNDGARLWVDDRSLINEWREGETREVSADMILAEGNHKIRIEFFKRADIGIIRLRWEKAPLSLTPTVTQTSTPTPTITHTSTPIILTATSTPTDIITTATPTDSPTTQPTLSPTTATETPATTDTPTLTLTPTNTLTPTLTLTPAITSTATMTATATITP